LRGDFINADGELMLFDFYINVGNIIFALLKRYYILDLNKIITG